MTDGSLKIAVAGVCHILSGSNEYIADFEIRIFKLGKTAIVMETILLIFFKKIDVFL